MSPRTDLEPSTVNAAGRALALRNGDHLSRGEFERRYEAMPHLKKAELVEGVVHVPSPARQDEHGKPHGQIVGWMIAYQAATPGTEVGNNATVRLDLDNEPQPDALLRIEPGHGGQSRTSADGYVEGAPELIAEVAASSASYDLHTKLNAYRRNGVREYIVWRTLDGEIDWFHFEGGEYRRLAPDAGGILKSRVFPGLWLDPAALLRGDLARVLAVVQEGAVGPDHAQFVERFQKPAATKGP